MDPIDRLIARAENSDRVRFGISLLTLGKFCGRVVTRDELHALTINDAKDIYRQMYWLPVHLDQLPVMIQDIMLDMTIQSGSRIAVQALQESLNIPVDYVIGPVTVAAAFQANQIMLLIHLVRWRALMIARVMKRDPSQLGHLAEWLSHTLSFLPLCEAYYE